MLVGGVAGEIGEGARPLLDIAHKNSERLVRLINDILDIEKLEAGHLSFHYSRCDIRALVEQALLDLKPYGDDYDVVLTLVVPDDIGPIEATVDPDRFAQVMANLLSNAIKHSPRGGVVSVDCIATAATWRSVSRIRARAFRKAFAHAYSNASPKPIRPIRASAAALGWGWRSPVRWCSRCTGTSASTRKRARARGSGCDCRCRRNRPRAHLPYCNRYRRPVCSGPRRVS